MAAGPTSGQLPQRSAAQRIGKGLPARDPSNRSTRQREQSRSSSSSAPAGDAARLSAQFLLDYERKGFCITKGLLQPQQLQPVKECVQGTIQQQRLQALKHR
jgi:hypothetical protein